MTATWVNADDSTYPAQTYYDPVVNFLGILGNLANYNNAFDDGAYDVTFVATAISVPEPMSIALIAFPIAIASLLRRRTIA